MAFQRRLMFLPSCLPKRPLRLVPYLEDGTKSFSSSSPIVLMCMSIGSLTLFPKQYESIFEGVFLFHRERFVWLLDCSISHLVSHLQIGLEGFSQQQFLSKMWFDQKWEERFVALQMECIPFSPLLETNWPAFGFQSCHWHSMGQVVPWSPSQLHYAFGSKIPCTFIVARALKHLVIITKLMFNQVKRTFTHQVLWYRTNRCYAHQRKNLQWLPVLLWEPRCSRIESW